MEEIDIEYCFKVALEAVKEAGEVWNIILV